MIHHHQFERSSCLHGETDETDGTCGNPRMKGSVFCAEHQPPIVDQCACGATAGIRHCLVISRFGSYPSEEGFVCPACLVNDAPGFEFYMDAMSEVES
jgi:hypothetical protein